MDPTLNDIREEIAEERDIAAEKARLDRKVALLKQLASASESLDKEIDGLKERRDTLKNARKVVKAVADNDNLSAEEIVEVLGQVKAARSIVSFAAGVVLADPFAQKSAPLFHDGGLIKSRGLR